MKLHHAQRPCRTLTRGGAAGGRRVSAGPSPGSRPLLLPWRPPLPTAGPHRGSHADLIPKLPASPLPLPRQGLHTQAARPPWRTPLPGPPLSSGPRQQPPTPGLGVPARAHAPSTQALNPAARGPHCAHTLPTPAAAGLRQRPRLPRRRRYGSRALRLPGAAHRCVPRTSTASWTGHGRRYSGDPVQTTPDQLQASTRPRTPERLGVLIRQTGTGGAVSATPARPAEQVLARAAGVCPRGPRARPTSPRPLVANTPTQLLGRNVPGTSGINDDGAHQRTRSLRTHYVKPGIWSPRRGNSRRTDQHGPRPEMSPPHHPHPGHCHP